MLNNYIGLAIRECMLEFIVREQIYKNIDRTLWEDIIDRCVFHKNGLRMLYNWKNGSYYKVNISKSTYIKLSKDNRYEHLK